MASQATITMDSSFGGYGDCPHMVDQMVIQPSMKWGHDTADLGFADVDMAAPGYLDDTLFSSEPATSIPDAKSGDFKLGYPCTLFEDVTFVGGSCDLESLLSGQATLPESVQVPAPEPEQDISWLTVSSDVSALIEISDPSKDLTAPGSPDSGISSLSAASSPGEVLSPEVALRLSPEPQAFDAPAPKTAAVSLQQNVIDSSSLHFPLQVAEEDLALLESLWENDLQVEPHPDSAPTSETLLTTVAVEPIAPAKLPLRPVSPCHKTLKSSKATRSLSSQEKKERKRAQNKNAATRYREKKREEARAIYEEQTKLEDINKGLKDKVTLITREMEYMKELLIEVYRAKGLIE